LLRAGSFEYVDLGKARIDNSNNLVVDCDTSRAFFFALNADFEFCTWWRNRGLERPDTYQSKSRRKLCAK